MFNTFKRTCALTTAMGLGIGSAIALAPAAFADVEEETEFEVTEICNAERADGEQQYSGFQVGEREYYMLLADLSILAADEEAEDIFVKIPSPLDLSTNLIKFGADVVPVSAEISQSVVVEQRADFGIEIVDYLWNDPSPVEDLEFDDGANEFTWSQDIDAFTHADGTFAKPSDYPGGFFGYDIMAATAEAGGVFEALLEIPEGVWGEVELVSEITGSLIGQWRDGITGEWAEPGDELVQWNLEGCSVDLGSEPEPEPTPRTYTDHRTNPGANYHTNSGTRANHHANTRGYQATG